MIDRQVDEVPLTTDGRQRWWRLFVSAWRLVQVPEQSRSVCGAGESLRLWRNRDFMVLWTGETISPSAAR